MSEVFDREARRRSTCSESVRMLNRQVRETTGDQSVLEETSKGHGELSCSKDVVQSSQDLRQGREAETCSCEDSKGT